MYRTASTGRCAHPHDRMLNKPTNYQQQQTPGLCVRVVYIAGDTLRHQPMGAGHMTVLQFRGPMAFHVLQWCHPMLASTTRTSCCIQMITLYGAGKWIQAHADTRNITTGKRIMCSGMRKTEIQYWYPTPPSPSAADQSVISNIGKS